MLPRLYNVPSQSNMTIDSFRGINITESAVPGEFTMCCNVDSVSFPAISSRGKRYLVSSSDGTINGTGSHEGVFYTFCKNGGKSICLWYKGNEYEFSSYSASDDFTIKRRFATLENCIMIIPDNVIFYTDTLSFKSAWVYQAYKYADAQKKADEELGEKVSLSFPNAAECGYIKHNSISSKKITYTYAGKSYDFYTIAFDDNLTEGDVITIKGRAMSPSATSGSVFYDFHGEFNSGITLKIKSVSKLTHNTANGKITEITELVFEDNSFNTRGFDDVYFEYITIEKKPPTLSFVTSFCNRVWGADKNMIYSSRLGDAREWNDFSIDSYGTLPSASFSSSAGSSGDFTGIISHGNYIYAFKENHIHKIYGDTPDEYRFSGFEAPGCAKNTHTLAVCGIYLVYASGDGIYILRDGYPQIISRKIGNIRPLCAAAAGNKYYVICKENDGRVIYVYDLDHDMWTMQSCCDDADNIIADSGKIYLSCGEKLVCLSECDGEEYEKNIQWSFRLRFDRNSFSNNTAIRAVARISLAKNASYTARIIYDDDSRSAICGMCYDETINGSSILRLPVKRDLGFCMEFRGTGGFVMRNIKFNYYKSSEE